MSCELSQCQTTGHAVDHSWIPLQQGLAGDTISLWRTLSLVALPMQSSIWGTGTYCSFSSFGEMSLLPSKISPLPTPLTGPVDHHQHIQQLLFGSSSFLGTEGWKGEPQAALGLLASQLQYQRSNTALALG